jgi:hypothetical protein
MSPELALKRARGDVDKLLKLGRDSRPRFPVLRICRPPSRSCAATTASRSKAQDWCLRMLEAQGPFFPKWSRLETLGELGAVHFIPGGDGVLSDRTRTSTAPAGAGAVGHGRGDRRRRTRAQARSALSDPDAAHSLLVLCAISCSRGSYEPSSKILDWFMEEGRVRGPPRNGSACFGTRTL